MNENTGAALRAQYAADGGVAATFSSKVADYAASRPDYPLALSESLGEMGALPPSASVADIGAGTGLLTAQLLARGHTVTAVEPSDGMRAACDARLAAQPRYRSVAGTAEATTLADASVDLVTAAQAFHWFALDAARREFLRILRPAGQVALIWNDRLEADPLHQAMDEVFARFGGAKRGALLAHEDRTDVPRFFGAAAPRQSEWPHAHRLDRAGLHALALSRSYMPARDSEAGREALHALDAVFERFAEAGAVTVRYRTVAIVGRPTV